MKYWYFFANGQAKKSIHISQSYEVSFFYEIILFFIKKRFHCETFKQQKYLAWPKRAKKWLGKIFLKTVSGLWEGQSGSTQEILVPKNSLSGVLQSCFLYQAARFPEKKLLVKTSFFGPPKKWKKKCESGPLISCLYYIGNFMLGIRAHLSDQFVPVRNGYPLPVTVNGYPLPVKISTRSTCHCQTTYSSYSS